MSATEGFPAAARTALADSQLRRNLGKATTTIRAKRARVVEEVADWEELRAAGAAIKDRALATLPEQLERLEAAVTAAGGQVHWARDAAEANATVVEIARAHEAEEVVKVKSIATDEIELNEALAAAGIDPIETDLAELIVQLGDDDSPSHILVPAIHRNREEIRALFTRTITGGADPGSEPTALTAAARAFLRERFLRAKVGVSGANFGVAETGTICVVESEGNGRFCTTVPEVLVTVMGIEKVLPQWRDLEVMLQLLPRSSTAERMNPYTSLWTGVRAGDGPREFHLVLLDNGRTDVLADRIGRQTLRCIRCSACLNSCPVYSRTGGHAYESVYPGPIGAILTPQLRGLDEAPTLPWASSLCGACADVCPVKIDIPSVLIHLRGRVVRETRRRARERAGGDGPRGPGVRLAAALRARPAPRAPRARTAARAGRPAAAGRVDGDARAARDPRRELPRLVALAMSEARDAVLSRIREALGPAPAVPEIPRDYRTAGAGEGGADHEVVERFAATVADYDVTVTRTDPDGLRDVLTARCAAHGAARVVVAPGLGLSPDGVEIVVDDPGLSPRDLDELDGVVTGCAVAIADTGTIALDGDELSGRRAATLVPDLHVCVVRAGQVVPGVAEAVARLRDAAAAGRPVTLVSGPSATSDIELERVAGVHGPRRLEVVLVDPVA